MRSRSHNEFWSIGNVSGVDDVDSEADQSVGIRHARSVEQLTNQRQPDSRDVIPVRRESLGPGDPVTRNQDPR